MIEVEKMHNCSIDHYSCSEAISNTDCLQTWCVLKNRVKLGDHKKSPEEVKV